MHLRHVIVIQITFITHRVFDMLNTQRLVHKTKHRYHIYYISTLLSLIIDEIVSYCWVINRRTKLQKEIYPFRLNIINKLYEFQIFLLFFACCHHHHRRRCLCSFYHGGAVIVNITVILTRFQNWTTQLCNNELKDLQLGKKKRGKKAEIEKN